MTSAGRLNRVEQQARTRAALIDAAAAAFAERGVHGASVEDICARAGFSRGAFYSNFERKEDLLMAVLDARERQDVAEITALFADDPDPVTFVDRLRTRVEVPAALDAHLLATELRAHALRDPAARERLAAFDRRQRDHYRRAIEHLLRQTGTAAPADLDLLALIAQSVIDGIALRSRLDPDLGPHTDLDALALLLDALTALGARRSDGSVDEPDERGAGRAG